MKNVMLKRKRNIVLDAVWFLFILVMSEYICFHIAFITRTQTQDSNVGSKISLIMDHIRQKPCEILINDKEILEIVLSYQLKLFSLLLLIGLMAWSAKSLKKGEFADVEHGSAEWAKGIELKQFKKDSGGVIVGEGLYLPLKSKTYNLNQLVIGGSGSGKTFRKIKPDILQANSSYIITDIKGEIYRDTANYLKKQGYKIKVLNLIDLKYSMKFNPFMYIQEDKDILILADTFIKNTENGQKESSSNDSFWTKAEFALLQALMFYIYKELPEEEWTFHNILKLLMAGIADNSSGEAKSKSALDIIFEELEEKNPDHIALKTYKMFKMAAPETSASILIGLSVRFGIFTTDDMVNLTDSDDMDLGNVGREKTAIYVMIPDTHRSFDVISAMFFSQMFQHLIYKADFEFKGSLPLHCRVMMDEFVNCGFIPYFDNMISTIRSRNISTTIIIQDLSQLKAKYKDNWQTIIGCCDTIIFMGSPENDTREYVSKLLGKTTVQQNSKSFSFGSKGGRSETVNYIQRDLMTTDELRVIPDKKQIVVIRSTKPIYCTKHMTESSTKYKYINDKADYRDIGDYTKEDMVISLVNEYDELLKQIEN